MPAVLFEKSQQIGRENFAIRGLQFCGFIKRHSSPTNNAASRVKPPPHHVKASGGFLKSTNDLLENAPLAPPPPYRHARPSSSSGSLTSSSDEEAAAKRRARRLSKPAPSSNQDFYHYVHERSSPLAKSFSTSALPASPSPTTKPISAPASPSPSPPSLNPPAPPTKRTSPSTTTKEKVTKTQSSLDSSGRSRPPVSGVRAKSSLAKQNSSSNDTTTHTYHYKRARAPSAADAPRRTQEAVLCLEALLDACESGAVEDMRHVIEQVILARKILIGDDDGIGLVKSIRGNSAEAGGGTVTGSSKAGASASVTSFATLSNLAP